MAEILDKFILVDEYSDKLDKINERLAAFVVNNEMAKASMEAGAQMASAGGFSPAQAAGSPSGAGVPSSATIMASAATGNVNGGNMAYFGLGLQKASTYLVQFTAALLIALQRMRMLNGGQNPMASSSTLTSIPTTGTTSNSGDAAMTARIAELEKRIEDLTQKQNENKKSLEEMNVSAINLADNGMNKLVGRITGLVASYVSLSAAKKMADEAMSVEQSEILIGAKFGDAGADISAWAKDFADKMGLARGETMSAVAGFANTMKMNGKQLMEATKLSEYLSRFNPENDFAGISKAITNAINTRSASGLNQLFGIDAREFNFKNFNADLAAGNIDSFIEKMYELAEQTGWTQDAYDSMFESAATKMERLGNMVQNAGVDAMAQFVTAMEPAIEKFTEWVSSSDGQQFFSSLGSVVAFAGQMIGFLVSNIERIGPPLLAAIVTWKLFNGAIALGKTLIASYTAMQKLSMAATAADTTAKGFATTAQLVLNAAQLASPILMIIAALTVGTALLGAFMSGMGGATNSLSGTIDSDISKSVDDTELSRRVTSAKGVNINEVTNVSWENFLPDEIRDVLSKYVERETVTRVNVQTQAPQIYVTIEGGKDRDNEEMAEDLMEVIEEKWEAPIVAEASATR